MNSFVLDIHALPGGNMSIVLSPSNDDTISKLAVQSSWRYSGQIGSADGIKEMREAAPPYFRSIRWRNGQEPVRIKTCAP